MYSRRCVGNKANVILGKTLLFKGIYPEAITTCIERASLITELVNIQHPTMVLLDLSLLSLLHKHIFYYDHSILTMSHYYHVDSRLEVT